ncbi:hypothetical protein N180_09825 [Pedobacter antarcticus 4BY]|uniref:HTH araC/xylS-type domain-containing protein n=2 Tax=Pedobacter antarcticus TaxID=34086 RepID=A0A081PEL0_9SPHI|nr:helix-turn-helix domain-containing protein [Pedobacter antarcticus]KEQ29133.1 hypothetical protein N180_09825 [Pedobacter antarcticus 4BY]SFE94859.1 Helix-turn-helix domain-containing protein [Pedobacter antarcticus]
MKQRETLEDFFEEKLKRDVCSLSSDEVQFNLLTFADCLEKNIRYRRRDYFKVTYTTGHHIIHHSDRSYEVNGPTMVFFSPEIPYTIESPNYCEKNSRYFIFRERYFSEYFRRNIKDFPFFSRTHNGAFALDDAQEKKVAMHFEEMQQELASDYIFKHDLIRQHIAELLHMALKLTPGHSALEHVDANVRLTAVFTELLERQFPIEPPFKLRFEMRSPGDYAQKLNVHVNHLNRVLKLTTGKTTSQHISEKMAVEARILLKHSQYNISEISYSLGFTNTTHFNHFFKRQTGSSPKTFRV